MAQAGGSSQHPSTGEMMFGGSGDPSLRALFTLAYDDLRAVAGSLLADERPGHTLQPTALVHEATLRLFSSRFEGVTRDQFLAIAAIAMRHVLVDHARARRAVKRGGAARRITLSEADAPTPDQIELDLLDLDVALEHLASHDSRAAQVAELRFFGGLTEEQVAAFLGVSRRAVQLDWAYARPWLARELSGQGAT